MGVAFCYEMMLELSYRVHGQGAQKGRHFLGLRADFRWYWKITLSIIKYLKLVWCSFVFWASIYKSIWPKMFWGHSPMYQYYSDQESVSGAAEGSDQWINIGSDPDRNNITDLTWPRTISHHCATFRVDFNCLII